VTRGSGRHQDLPTDAGRGRVRRMLDVAGRASPWELVMDNRRGPPRAPGVGGPRIGPTGWWFQPSRERRVLSANLVISVTPIAAGIPVALSIPTCRCSWRRRPGGWSSRARWPSCLCGTGAGPGRRAGAQGPAARRGALVLAHRARRGALKAAFGPSRPRHWLLVATVFNGCASSHLGVTIGLVTRPRRTRGTVPSRRRREAES